MNGGASMVRLTATQEISSSPQAAAAPNITVFLVSRGRNVMVGQGCNGFGIERRGRF